MDYTPLDAAQSASLACDLAAAAARVGQACCERDELIGDAAAAGWPLREIARYAGLSHTTIARIITDRAR